MSSDNIKVAVRVRPLINREKLQNLKPEWKVQDTIIYEIDYKGVQCSEPYCFDHIFDEDSTNKDIYNKVCQPLIKSYMEGFNTTIFAYGQTSSGKTHTMHGSGSIKDEGLIELSIKEIFNKIDATPNKKFLLRASYIEIYNEKLKDLLDKDNKDLKIRENIHGMITTTAKETIVTSRAQIVKLMKDGEKNRQIGETNMNERSSRSHTIFRIVIEVSSEPDNDGVLMVQVSSLNLVDLAGSERAAQTKATGARLREGGQINKSLSTLSNVIRQLSDGQKFVSFRDSQLTRILQNSLGGNANTLIIANITVTSVEDTHSTLSFAQRAKTVKNIPQVNIDMDEEAPLTKKYAQEAADLKKQLNLENTKNKELLRSEEEHLKIISKLKEKLVLLEENFVVPKTVKRRHTIGGQTMPRVKFTMEVIPEAQEDLICQEIPPHLVELSPDRPPFKEIDKCSTTSKKGKLSYNLEKGLKNQPVSPKTPTSTNSIPKTPESALRRRIKDLNDEYETLLEFTNIEKELSDEEVIDDKEEIIRLKKQLADHISEIFDLNSLVQTMREEQYVKDSHYEKNYIDHSKEVNCLKEKISLLNKEISQKNSLQLTLEELKKEHEYTIDYMRSKHKDRETELLKQLDEVNEELTKKWPLPATDFTKLKLLDIKIKDLEEQLLISEDKYLEAIQDLDNEKRINEKMQVQLTEIKQKFAEEVESIPQECSDLKSKLLILENILQNDFDSLSSQGAKQIEELNKIHSDEIKELMEEIGNLKEKLELLHLNNDGGQIDELQKELEANKNYIKELTSNNAELSQNVLEYQRLQTEHDDRIQEILKLKSNLDELSQSVNDWQQKYTTLETVQHDKIAILEENKTILEKRVEDLSKGEQEIIELKNRVKEHAELVQELIENKTTLEMRITEITATNNEFSLNVIKSQKELEELETEYRKQIQELTENKTSLEARVEDLLKCKQDMQKEINKLKETLESTLNNEEFSQSLIQWQEKCTRLETKNSEYCKQIEGLIKGNYNVSDLQSQLDANKNYIEELSQTVLDLKTKHSELETKNTEYHNQILELTNIKSNLEKLMQDLSEKEVGLEKELEANKNYIKELSQTVLDWKTKHSELETEHTKYHNQILELTNNKSDLEKKIQDLSEKEIHSEKELDANKNYIEELSQTVLDWKTKHSELETKNTEYHNKILELTKNKSNLEKLIQDLSGKELKANKNYNEELSQSVLDLKTKHSKLETENIEYQNQILDLMNNKSHLEKLIEDLSEKEVSSKKEMEANNNYIEELLRTVLDWKTKHSELETKNTEYHNQISELTNNKSNLEKIIEDLSEKEANSQKELDANKKYIKELSQTVLDCKTKHSELETKITEYHNQILDLTNNKSNLENLIQDLEASKNYNKELSQSVLDWKTKHSESETKNTEYREQILELTNNNSSLEKLIQDLSERENNLKQVLSAVNNEISTKEDILQNLTDWKNKYTTLVKENTTLNKQLEIKLQKSVQSNNQIAELTNRLTELENVKKNLVELEQKYATSKADLGKQTVKLGNKIEELQQKTIENYQYRKQIKEITEKLNKISMENSELEERIKNLSKEEKTTTNLQQNLSPESPSAIAELENKLFESNQVQSEQHEVNANEIEKLNNTIKEQELLIANSNALRKQYNELKKQSVISNDQLKKLKENRHRYVSTINELHSKIKELQKDKSQLQEELKNLSKQNDDSKKNYEGKITKLEEEIKLKTNEIISLKTNMTEVQLKLEKGNYFKDDAGSNASTDDNSSRPSTPLNQKPAPSLSRSSSAGSDRTPKTSPRELTPKEERKLKREIDIDSRRQIYAIPVNPDCKSCYKLSKRLNSIQYILGQRDEKIAELTTTINEKGQEYRQLSDTMNIENDSLKEKTEKANKRLTDLERQLSEKRNELTDLERQLSEKSNVCMELEKENERLINKIRCTQSTGAVSKTFKLSDIKPLLQHVQIKLENGDHLPSQAIITQSHAMVKPKLESQSVSCERCINVNIDEIKNEVVKKNKELADVYWKYNKLVNEQKPDPVETKKYYEMEKNILIKKINHLEQMLGIGKEKKKSTSKHSTSTQTVGFEYDLLFEKYNKMKKVCKLRQEENQELRKKLAE